MHNLLPSHSEIDALASSAQLGAAGIPRSVSGSTRPRRLVSDELLAGGSEVLIEHGPSVYRLRLTALGKLILTK